MDPTYTYFADLAKAVEVIPEESIVSRTIYKDDAMKAIVFAFAAGQELSQHTAAVPAIVHILEGECDLTVGPDAYQAQAGSWVHMPPNMPHSIFARTPVRMLLLMM
jgi:quercetin dioxygenase-like cupin family protein